MKRGVLNTATGQAALNQMSYGVVSNRGRPAEWQTKPMAYEETPAETNPAEQDQDMLMVTTQPARPNDDAIAERERATRGGWTECVITPRTKSKIISYASFPTPVPKLPTPAYTILPTDSPSIGLGLFALRDIQPGELVLAERALLLTPVLFTGAVPGDLQAKLSAEEIRQGILSDKEEEYRIAVDRMLEADREAYHALSNCHLHDGSGPVCGIMRTNGFGVTCYQSPEDMASGSYGDLYSVVCKNLSRANHSCQPNMTRTFKGDTFAMHAYATRFIKKGEALTVSYCSTDMSYERRQKKLAPYGFVCTCPKCESEAPKGV